MRDHTQVLTNGFSFQSMTSKKPSESSRSFEQLGQICFDSPVVQRQTKNRIEYQSILNYKTNCFTDNFTNSSFLLSIEW
ncbi:hypothetical protein M595_5667 [Lyngbya aestuarii BL J]|uniref:Uncharacterized protein n=1 Tax=Lyngbya aestuarii BL J TaxID=1348334 RepID=U7QBK5_9CYAN|nr:hypothetical protein M595_5667 [Lyngbya aestuarii BL J]